MDIPSFNDFPGDTCSIPWYLHDTPQDVSFGIWSTAGILHNPAYHLLAFFCHHWPAYYRDAFSFAYYCCYAEDEAVAESVVVVVVVALPLVVVARQFLR